MEVVNNEVTTVRGTCLRTRLPAVPTCLMSPFSIAGGAGELCPSEVPPALSLSPGRETVLWCLLLGRKEFAEGASPRGKDPSWKHPDCPWGCLGIKQDMWVSAEQKIRDTTNPGSVLMVDKGLLQNLASFTLAHLFSVWNRRLGSPLSPSAPGRKP